MHQGIVKVVFIPLTYADASLARINPVDISINEHVTLFANTSTPAQLSIPYVSPVNYLDVKIPAEELVSSLGTLYVVVFNPLAASTNSTLEATISMWASMPNSQFKVPRLKPFSGFRAEGLLDPFNAIINPLKGLAAAGLSSATGGLVPKEFISDGIDVLRNVTGLDKPSNYMEDPPQTYNSVGPMNYAVGQVYLDKLTPFPAQVGDMSSADISSRSDEMSFDFLKTRSSYLGTFSISASSVPGDLLAYYPVNPITTDQGRLTYQPTLLGYLSMPFQLWQGSIKYRFEVCATSLQTTKVFVAFNPGVFVPSTLDLQAISSQYGITFDIAQGSNSFEFEAPFIAPTPFLEVPHNNSTTLGVSKFNTVGMVHVVLLNRLVCPNNVPTTIYVNVYVSAGDNFILRNLSTANKWTPIEPATTLKIESTEFVAQMMQATEPLNAEKEEEQNITMTKEVAKDSITGPKEGTINPGVSLTTRDYCKKYQLIDVDVSPILSDESYCYYKIDLRDIISMDNSVRTHGLLEWFTAPHRCFHGGLRFKLSVYDRLNLPEVGSTSFFKQIRVYYLPPLAFTEGYNAIDAPFNGSFNYYNDALNPMTRLNVSMINGVDKTLHFEVPFSTLFNFVLTKDSIDAAFSTSIYTDIGSILIFFEGVVQDIGRNKFTIHAAYADESRAFCLYKVPLLGRADIYYPDQWEGAQYCSLTNLF